MSGSLAKMLAAGKSTVEAAEVTVAGPVPEARRSFGSKLRPSLHRSLKASVLEFQDQLGRNVRVEDVLETLITQLRDDPELRREVLRRLRETG